MTKRYLGNIITQNPTAPAGPYESDAAPGVWSLAEAFAYSKAGLWPTAGNVNVRMVIQHGLNDAGSVDNTISYIQMATLGNSVDFGDYSGGDADKAYKNASASSSTRGVMAGGNSNNSNMQYVTIATTGNTTNFGTISSIGREYLRGCSNGVIGVFAGGENSGVRDTGDQITIATTGNTTNFGDLSVRVWKHASCASNTRGIMAGGVNSGGSTINSIQYYTFASPNTSVDFGDLTEVKHFNAGASNSTRGIFSGNGNSTPTLDYITIASTGNATDFGDMTAARYDVMAAASSTRAIWAGGDDGTTPYNIIDYVEIATTGNAVDFGDLISGARNGTAFSDGHGGIA
jgi:hypothetical protein